MSSETHSPLPVLVFERFRLTIETPAEEAQLLPLFYQTVNEKMARMRAAIAAQDPAAWYSATHYLKGATANLGMEALAAVCREAEAITPENPEAELLLDRIAGEFLRVRDFLAGKPTSPGT